MAADTELVDQFRAIRDRARSLRNLKGDNMTEEDTQLFARMAAVLARARRLIQQGWCRNHNATDRHGHEVSFLNPKAARFCAIGATQRAVYDLRKVKGITKFCDEYWSWQSAVDDAMLRLNEHLPPLYTNLPEYNDNRATKKADVLGLFDRAIAKK